MNYLLLSLVIYLFIILTAAFLSAKKSKQIKKSNFLSEYFLGSRSLNGFVLAMSISATYISASSFIGGPSAAYKYGLGWVFLAMIQVPVAIFSLGFLGKKIAYLSNRYNLITFNDLIYHKYKSKTILFLSSFAIIISFFAMMSVQFFGAGRLLEVTLDIPYESAILIFASSVILYTFIGGFRAVVLTDAIQGGVMILGSLILLCAVIFHCGGVANAVESLRQIDENLLSPMGISIKRLDFTFMISFWFLVCFGILALPSIVVRNMAYKKSSSLHFAIIAGTIVIAFIMFTMHLSGAIGRVILPDLKITDQIIPLLMLKTLDPVIAGIFLASPMAAIMSSVDSMLIQSSSTIVKDLILNIKPEFQSKEDKIKNITLAINLLFTFLLILAALKPPKMIIWINLNALGLIEASFFWLIVFGLCYKKANFGGAICSMFAGFGSYCLMILTSFKIANFHTIVPAIVISGIFFVIGNVWFKRKNKKVFSS